MEGENTEAKMTLAKSVGIKIRNGTQQRHVHKVASMSALLFTKKERIVEAKSRNVSKQQ